MTREALRQGVDGALSDMAIYARPWQIDVAAVKTPAVLWQGTADHIVPADLAFDLPVGSATAASIACRAKAISGCSTTSTRSCARWPVCPIAPGSVQAAS
ncbi:MAG: hypothetical protein R3D67_20310 [Hyphomicrobiaceae bacterium]